MHIDIRRIFDRARISSAWEAGLKSVEAAAVHFGPTTTRAALFSERKMSELPRLKLEVSEFLI